MDAPSVDALLLSVVQTQTHAHAPRTHRHTHTHRALRMHVELPGMHAPAASECVLTQRTKRPSLATAGYQRAQAHSGERAAGFARVMTDATHWSASVPGNERPSGGARKGQGLTVGSRHLLKERSDSKINRVIKNLFDRFHMHISRDPAYSYGRKYNDSMKNTIRF